MIYLLIVFCKPKAHIMPASKEMHAINAAYCNLTGLKTIKATIPAPNAILILTEYNSKDIL